MAGTKKKRSSGKKQSGKRFSLTFGWSGLVSAILVLGIALVWAFIFGVIIGRGYYPETLIPALSKVVPQKEQTRVAARPEKPSGEPLNADELGFINSLSERKKETGSGQAERQSGTQTKRESARQRTEKRAKPEGRYVYRYQVAALQSKQRARKVVRELKAKGMRVALRTVDKDGVTWYRIHVRFTGGPSETERFKRRLEGYGLGSPFLRDKAKLD